MQEFLFEYRYLLLIIEIFIGIKYTVISIKFNFVKLKIIFLYIKLNIYNGIYLLKIIWLELVWLDSLIRIYK